MPRRSRGWSSVSLLRGLVAGLKDPDRIRDAFEHGDAGFDLVRVGGDAAGIVADRRRVSAVDPGQHVADVLVDALGVLQDGLLVALAELPGSAGLEVVHRCSVLPGQGSLARSGMRGEGAAALRSAER